MATLELVPLRSKFPNTGHMTIRHYAPVIDSIAPLDLIVEDLQDIFDSLEAGSTLETGPTLEISSTLETGKTSEISTTPQVAEGSRSDSGSSGETTARKGRQAQ